MGWNHQVQTNRIPTLFPFRFSRGYHGISRCTWNWLEMLLATPTALGSRMLNVLPTYPRMFTDRWVFLDSFCELNQIWKKWVHNCSSNFHPSYSKPWLSKVLFSWWCSSWFFVHPTRSGRSPSNWEAWKQQIDPFKIIQSSIPAT